MGCERSLRKVKVRYYGFIVFIISLSLIAPELWPKQKITTHQIDETKQRKWYNTRFMSPIPNNIGTRKEEKCLKFIHIKLANMLIGKLVHTYACNGLVLKDCSGSTCNMSLIFSDAFLF